MNSIRNHVEPITVDKAFLLGEFGQPRFDYSFQDGLSVSKFYIIADLENGRFF